MAEECYMTKVSGCACPENMYMQNGTCVPAHECECYYEGRSFLHGDVTKMKCNKWYV